MKRMIVYTFCVMLICSMFTPLSVEAKSWNGKMTKIYCKTQGNYVAFKWKKVRGATKYKISYAKRMTQCKNGRFKLTNKWKRKTIKKNRIKFKAKKGQMVFITVIPCRGKKKSKHYKYCYHARVTKKKWGKPTVYDRLYIFCVEEYLTKKKNYPCSPFEMEGKSMDLYNDYRIDFSQKTYNKVYKNLTKYEKINWSDLAYRKIKKTIDEYDNTDYASVKFELLPDKYYKHVYKNASTDVELYEGDTDWDYSKKDMTKAINKALKNKLIIEDIGGIGD